ncbi:hypothetical protein LDENG_00016680 [Lucifuga dentata]|nr:hypothetical protein LDENG_00016680 [Lucifuga dentata]
MHVLKLAWPTYVKVHYRHLFVGQSTALSVTISAVNFHIPAIIAQRCEVSCAARLSTTYIQENRRMPAKPTFHHRRTHKNDTLIYKFQENHK